jgi:SAM-dependent methyltransferase
MKDAPRSISHTATTRRVLALLEDVLARTASRAPTIADVGCGRGHFSAQALDELRRRGAAAPTECVVPVDLLPEYFEVAELTCRPIGPGGRLPIADATVDAAVSIEVIEHVEDQFAFLRELARITKPGGTVIVTTPNVHNVASRLRALWTGFPQLYDPLPLARTDPRFLGGHIHPIHPYFLCYGAHRAGLEVLGLEVDRRKTTAALGAALLAPVGALVRFFHRSRLARKHPEIFRENADWLARVSSWDLATGRSAILVARVPAVNSRA